MDRRPERPTVQNYRLNGVSAGALSVRLDYQKIVDSAQNGKQATVLCDLESGVNKCVGGGALIYAGSICHKFNLWIPNADS